MFGETAGRRLERLFAGRRFKSRVGTPAMVKALQRWLEANGLFGIAAGVLGTVLLISIILVVGGYLIVLALS